MNDQRLPSRRRAHLVERRVSGETVLYDASRHEAHHLDELTSVVWAHCDGRSTYADAVQSLKDLEPAADSNTVERALSRLDEVGVLQAGVSRRAVLTGAATIGVGGILLPTVTSIAGPLAEAHASTMQTIVLISTLQKAGKRDPAVEANDTATGRYNSAFAYTNGAYATIPGTGWVSFNKDGNGVNQHYYYRCPFTLPNGYNNASITVTALVDDSAVVWLQAPTTALGGTQIGTVPSYVGTPAVITYSTAGGFTAGTQYLYFVESNSGGGPEGIDFTATITYSS